jgi:hypothetical protein
MHEDINRAKVIESFLHSPLTILRNAHIACDEEATSAAFFDFALGGKSFFIGISSHDGQFRSPAGQQTSSGCTNSSVPPVTNATLRSSSMECSPPSDGHYSEKPDAKSHDALVKSNFH